MDGDADAAVEARIRIGGNKFRLLVPLLTSKNISLIIMTRKLYGSCVRSSVLQWNWDVASKEGKSGDTSAGRDENGLLDVALW